MSASLWLSPEPLLLASTSSTRRDMLLAAGIPIETRAPQVDERAVDAQARAEQRTAAEIAALLAEAKTLAVSREAPGRLVLGADQTLDCEGKLFDKPADVAAAHRQLAEFSGREHVLHSAAVLARDGEVLARLASDARLTMRPLSDAFITEYLACVGASATRSVGGYQLEGLGSQLFRSIQGDHFTILGLPLFAVLDALRSEGALRG